MRDGVLRLENAVIQSNLPLVISVEGTGQLIATDSQFLLDASGGAGALYVVDGPSFGGVAVNFRDVVLDGDFSASSEDGATLTMRGTTFRGTSVHIDTPTTTRLWDPVFASSVTNVAFLSDDGDVSTVDFDIRNATFNFDLTGQLRFRGDQYVQLTSVQVTKGGNWWEGMVEGGAKVSRFWWLEVRAVDGTSTLVPNARIDISIWDEPSLNWVNVPPLAGNDVFLAQPPVTVFPVFSPSGVLLYRARSEDRFASAPHWSNATYLVEGDVFLDGIFQYPYPQGNLSTLMTADMVLFLRFSQLTPDFSVYLDSITGENGIGYAQPVGRLLTIRVVVSNGGNIDFSGVTVYVYRTNIDTNLDGVVDATLSENFLAGATTVDVPARGNVTAAITWIPGLIESPELGIIVDRWDDVRETNETNNTAITAPLTIFGWPNAAISATDIDAAGAIVENVNTVRITVHNVGLGRLTQGSVTLVDGVPGDDVVTFGGIDAVKSLVVVVLWRPRDVTSETITVTVSVAPRCPAPQTPELCDYDLSNDVTTRTVNLLTKPDLSAVSSDYVGDGQNFAFTSGVERTLTVHLNNLGLTAALDVPVEIYMDSLLTSTVGAGTITRIDPLLSADLAVRVTVLGVGPHVLNIHADPDNVVQELNENNNNVSIAITVALPPVSVSLDLPASESSIIPGGGLEVIGRVTVAGSAGIVVVGVPVNITLRDPSGVLVASAFPPPVTEADGYFRASLSLPEGLPIGTYTFAVSITTVDGPQTFPVSLEVVPPPPQGIPLWLILVVVLVIVGIVGVVAYTKFYGLGKMVECGNCNTFIPEDAAKCPNCGVEFEKDMAKCSNCQSWIPMNVKACPECHVEFTTGEVEVQEYQDKMKQQYNEFIARMRRDANAAAGRKLADREFETWWMAQPNYVTFEDWLREEEDMRKHGSRACPNCQTLNSVTARVCHKCGTILMEPAGAARKPAARPLAKAPAEGVPPKGQPPQTAPPKVIRRPPGEQAPVQPVPKKPTSPESDESDEL